MKTYGLEAFARAVDRLEEALTLPSSNIVRDACIQRFEFGFELAWKAVQQASRNHGRDCMSPRSCLREAVAMGWLADEQAWLAMLADRNLTSHTYDEALAQAVYIRLRQHLPLLQALKRSPFRFGIVPQVRGAKPTSHKMSGSHNL